MNKWEENARAVEKDYGEYVDWEERFYICPRCGEPVYECDWLNEVLSEYICPICEDEE